MRKDFGARRKAGVNDLIKQRLVCPLTCLNPATADRAAKLPLCRITLSDRQIVPPPPRDSKKFGQDFGVDTARTQPNMLRQV